jgi:beta-glucosidase
MDPVYPFGYGLSYTEFAYTNFDCSPKIVNTNNPNSTLIFSVDVTNIGSIGGDEVVQLYRIGHISRYFF